MEFRIGEKNRKKLKLMTAVTGMLVGFYLFFQYILPLIWPLVIGWILALLFYPVVNFLYRFLKINKILGTVLLLLVLTAAIGALLSVLVDKITEQLLLVVDNFEYYQKNVENILDKACCGLEQMLHLQDGYLSNIVNNELEGLSTKLEVKIMQIFIGTSFPAVKTIMDIIIAAATVLVAFFLIIKDMEIIRKGMTDSVFRSELTFIRDHFRVVIHAYVRAQLIIMLIVAAASVAGLLCAGNRYAWVIGISVGVLDALPLLGSGMILVPMTIIYLIKREFLHAAILFTTFIVCYFAREYLEPKLMGDKMGVHPLVTLIGIFAGYRLFGFLGMFAGALTVIFITDVVKLLEQS
jgi:sporulation integral membrane protein YtvI